MTAPDRSSAGRVVRAMLLLLVTSIPAGPLAVAAQDTPTVGEGQRVRVAPNPVSPGERWLRGTVDRTGADTVWLRVAGFGEALPVARSSVERVQVAVRPDDLRPRALRGGMIGAVTGAVAGALVGRATWSGGCEYVCLESRTQAAVVGGVLGAAAGAEAGALLGAVTAARWADARFPGEAPAAAPRVLRPHLRLRTNEMRVGASIQL